MKLVILIILIRIDGNTIFDSGPMTSFEHNKRDYRNRSKPIWFLNNIQELRRVNNAKIHMGIPSKCCLKRKKYKGFKCYGF